MDNSEGNDNKEKESAAKVKRAKRRKVAVHKLSTRSAIRVLWRYSSSNNDESEKNVLGVT